MSSDNYIGAYYEDDDYSTTSSFVYFWLGRAAKAALIIGAIILVVLYLWGSIREGYKPCIDCDDQTLPKTHPAVINPYVWPYSGASCPEDLYVMDRQVRGESTAQPLVSLNTPDHVVLSSVSFVV